MIVKNSMLSKQGLVMLLLLLLACTTVGNSSSTTTITDLMLVDARSDTTLLSLSDGATLRIGTDIPTDDAKLTVEAVVNDPANTISKIQFDYNDVIDFSSDDAAPYTLCGDNYNGNNYIWCHWEVLRIRWVLPAVYTVKATAYDNDNFVIDEMIVSFTVTNEPTSALPKVSDHVQLVWVDAATNAIVTDVAPLVDGVNYTTNLLPRQRSILGVIGNDAPNFAKVRFGYNLVQNRYTELYPPYSFCGDDDGNYHNCPVLSNVRLHTLYVHFLDDVNNPVAVPYSLQFRILPAPPTPVPMSLPTPMPALDPTPVPTSDALLTGSWTNFPDQDIFGRHEASFIMVGTKGFLIGGRETRAVNIYDSVADKWSRGKFAPAKLHHMQSVEIGGKLYFPAAWSGYYPKETLVSVMHIYDATNNKWETADALPPHRRRGAAAVVVDGTKLWVSHGNVGGHETEYGAGHAKSVGWIDMYDTIENTWTVGMKEDGTVVFPDAPNPRDHTGGAFVDGRICVAAGRNGGELGWPAVSATDCFDPESNTWTVEADIPVQRSGSSYGTSCDGRLVVAGGERDLTGRVDVFDGSHWSTFANDLIIPRHGSGLGFDCLNDKIYVASGSPQGGGGTTESMEVYAY